MCCPPHARNVLSSTCTQCAVIHMYICTYMYVCVGLHHAKETGAEGDPNPVYYCTLCKVQSDTGNEQLHFTSAAHRLNVLVRPPILTYLGLKARARARARARSSLHLSGTSLECAGETTHSYVPRA